LDQDDLIEPLAAADGGVEDDGASDTDWDARSLPGADGDADEELLEEEELGDLALPVSHCFGADMTVELPALASGTDASAATAFFQSPSARQPPPAPGGSETATVAAHAAAAAASATRMAPTAALSSTAPTNSSTQPNRSSAAPTSSSTAPTGWSAAPSVQSAGVPSEAARGTGPRPAAWCASARRGGKRRWTVRLYKQWVKRRLVKGNHVLHKMVSFTVNPPDPVAAQHILCPEDYYLPRIIVHAPFDLRGPYRPFCPTCGSEDVTADGWSNFRRVIDMDECIFAIFRRYRCSKNHKNNCFRSWDDALLERAPPHVRLAFPVIFTRRLGVTQMVFDSMRSWAEGGSGFGPFATYMRENHTRRHHRKELAYMSRLADLMAESPTGESRISGCSAETARQFPRFSLFNDPDGYDGVHGSKNFYRSVYTRGMKPLEGFMKQRCAMVPARMLSGDHFFKILKCNFKFNGTETLVLHVSRMRSFPHQLRALLADPTVVKAGKSIGGDRKKLLADFGVDVKSTIELGNFAKARQLVGSATIGLAGLVSVLLKRVLDKDPAVRLSDWSRELTADQQTYAAMDSYASLLVYQYIFSAESPVPSMTSTLIGKQLYLADASGTRRVARCVVADAQPAKYGNLVVGAKERVWVKVVEVLVPAFALPYSPKRGPRSLAELMRESAQLGKDPLMVASRLHLRDADHAVERRLAAERAQVLHPVTAVSGGVAGCFDAMEGLRASVATMCEKGVVPGVAVGDKDAETDDEESPDGGALPVGGAFSGSGDAGGEEAVEGDGEDLSDPEAAADGGAAARGLLSGVKADILHVLDRVLRHAPKNHGATAHFSRCFVHALMFYNDGDAQLAERVAAEKWPEMTWLEVLYRKATSVNRRVRRAVPAAVVIVPRLEAVFKEFANILDASTGQRLFNSAAKSAARKVIKMAKAGWLTDPTDAPLYTLRTHDQDGLPLWPCSRGTNSNEGSVHQKLVKNFMSMRGASAELIHYALVEWVHRHNLRAARKNRTGGACIGHADTWILDDILLLQEHVFGKGVSHLSHERVAEYTLPEFYCGVTPLAPDVLDECGLQGKEMWKQMEPLFKRMSKQKRYLAAAMGSGVPILPVHTKEERLLYLELKERLRRQLLGTPTALAMANEFNKAAADDWLRHATKAAAQKHKRKGRMQMPMIHFKTVGHMTMYQAFYDRNQNIASTILRSHPNKSKPRIAGANVGRMGFGAAASSHKPVSARVPSRSSSGKSVSTGASSRSHAGQSLAPINGDSSTGIVAGALCDVGGARKGGAGAGWEETAGAEAVREMDDAAAVGGGGETVGAAEVETSGEAVDAAAAGVGKGPCRDRAASPACTPGAGDAALVPILPADFYQAVDRALNPYDASRRRRPCAEGEEMEDPSPRKRRRRHCVVCASPLCKGNANRSSCPFYKSPASNQPPEPPPPSAGR